MRKLVNTLTLLAIAAVSSAQIMKIGTYASDAFIYGVNGSSSSGYVNVKWSGYETPSYGNTGWRVVVWDTLVPQYPVASETYHASFYNSNYSRTFAVTPDHPIRVELYAVGNQHANSAALSYTVTTSMWVTPVDTIVNSTASWDYPVTVPVYALGPRLSYLDTRP